MKRDIKFRVWRESTKEMLQNVGFHPHLSMDLAADDEFYHTNEDGRWLCSPGLGYIFMQYTGLKDKNGKEIYEWDIVKYWGGIAPVVYDKYGFAIKYTEHDMFDINEPDKLEVLGNIYENPELLNQ